MHLFKESRQAVAWVAAVLRAFFRVRPWTTLALILAATFSQICTLLAFLLPLKVILLAGSDTVPNYLRFLVHPDHKREWIFILSIGAVGLYALSLALTSASRRLAETGASQVVQIANEEAVTGRHHDEARTYYSRFCGIAANSLLPTLGLVALAFVDPWLLTTLVGFVFIGFLVTARLLEHGDSQDPRTIQGRIRGNPSGFLGILNSVAFMGGFFVILIPFLLGSAGNRLVAILSVLLLRQLLNALSRAMRETVALWSRRPQIDPLVFREQPLQPPGRVPRRELHQDLTKAERERVAIRQLALAGQPVDELFSEWRDTHLRDVYTFVLRTTTKGNGDPRYFQQRVFAGSQRSLLEREEVLFTHLRRESLRAPEVVARFDTGPLAIQICEYGTGEPFEASRWKEICVRLVTHYWLLQPPPALLDAPGISRPALEQRLSTEYLEQITVAIDDNPEVKAFDRFLSILPELQKALSQIPTYICNPEIGPANVVSSIHGDPLVMSWGRWSAEPLGAILPKRLRVSDLSEALEVVRDARELAPNELTPAHIRLAHECRALERNIVQGAYKRALARLTTIADSALVKELR